MKKIYWFFYRLIRPSFWFFNEKYDKSCDDIIDYVVDNNIGSVEFGGYLLNCGEFSIWISNYPYSYGMIYHPYSSEFRPSVEKILKLKNYINKIKYKNIIND